MWISMSNKSSRLTASKFSLRSESGVTLIEMTIALLIIMIGLLALASAIGYALAVSNKGRNVTNTKLMVVSVLEQMETLRNTKQLTFGQIANTGEVDNLGSMNDFEGFETDFQPVSSNPGPDGIFGTGDDLVEPGSDGIYGTNDDTLNEALARPGYTREIVITPLTDDLKRIEVTLRYPGTPGQWETISGISYLNNDAHSNFLP
jgi:competence protein ComGC